MGIFFAAQKIRGATTMKTVNDIGKKLLERRREIIRVLGHLKRESDEITETRQIDWLDEASEANTVRTRDRLREIYEAELDGIERALARIHTGTFGICKACHRPIESKRLEICLDTEFCAVCAAMREEFVSAA
jgi:RNA polymerase-binding transcription factor DksA